MKKNLIILVCMAQIGISYLNAQTMSGIINFSMNGYVRGMTVGSDNKEPDIQFIGESSTKIGDSLLAHLMLTHTEKELETFLGHPLTPVNRERKSHVPDHINGSLMIMETFSEKKALKELNYDEAITIQCNLGYGSMKTVKGNRMYTPTIQVMVKVVGKDGKNIYKKNETLKLKDNQVSGALVEVKDNDNTSFDISLKSLNTAQVTTKGGGEHKGIASTDLFEWYKQALSNVLIRE